VALLVQPTSEWHRQLLRGVADYAREHGPWYLHIEPRGLLETMQLPKSWRGEGIILRLVERALRRRGLPAGQFSRLQIGQQIMEKVKLADKSTKNRG